MSEAWSVEIRGESNIFVLQSGGMIVTEGDLSVEFGATGEKLATPGVNSYRTRERSREMKDLRLQVMEDMLATKSIYRTESIYKLMEMELVTLTVSLLGERVRWKHVMVQEVQIVGRDGPLIGRMATSGSKHTVSSIWSLWRQEMGEVLE